MYSSRLIWITWHWQIKPAEAEQRTGSSSMAQAMKM